MKNGYGDQRNDKIILQLKKELKTLMMQYYDTDALALLEKAG